MGGAAAADYAWLSDRWTDGVGTTELCINFVRDLSPADAMRRITVTPGTSGKVSVAAYAAQGGTVLADTGWGTRYVTNVAEPLSLGTAVATVFANVEDSEFSFWSNERLITTFGLYGYRYREGDDSDRLLADARDLNLCGDGYCENHVAGALALASRVTGVHLSRAHYARPALTGSSDHLQAGW
ncbi:hypothetical protein BKM31_41080 [[Actinomadura] parvosata subsp. kistnae]|uniref:Uncharacterized protein n=1 Tax=[Actinomadura] parvosata subsp. kistnae TaxID=1909395 RepID=A0A1V0AA30_9ACTN|nr:DUF6461 domain-containing protein [Nonomuraea sp. ATCC 55076]AQZ67002.1 hypothetical protein BKM31_41080 [Nonomuraea sp. ATCC 55076]